MTTRTFLISRAEAGQPLAAVVRSHLSLPWAEAQRLVREHRVRLGGVLCPDPARRVRRGQRVQVNTKDKGAGTKDQKRKRPEPVRRASVDLDPRIIRHADAQVIVVDKPAGLTTMRHPEEAAEFGARARRYLPPTLADLLPELLTRRRPGKPLHVRPVHRLDKETSGLVVFALTPDAESHLGKQFRTHTIERRYLAVVRGRAQSSRIESSLVEDRGDGRRGSTTQPGVGKRAVTHVRVVEELGEYTLVECRLETGRTHQVRIHLGEAGTPLCGERVYDRPLHGKPVPDGSGARRPILHAASLGLTHPATGQWMEWHAPLPKDVVGMIQKLKGIK